MKTSNQHILEYLIINKDYRDAGLSPKSFDELRKIIEDRYDKLGPGTKDNPIDFNDVDVSNLDSFCGSITGIGIFAETKFKYIDISDWDVSNVTNMGVMFYNNKNLVTIYASNKFITDNVTSSTDMFYGASNLIGGNGTKYNKSNVNKTYARIDGGTSSPGYFTKK